MITQIGRKIYTFDIINMLILTAFTICVLYPFVYVIAISLSDTVHVLKNEVFIIPLGFNLKAYEKVFQDPYFITSYLNTFKYTIVGTTINILLTAMTAYPLSKKYLKGHKIIMFAITLTMIFSGGMIPNYILIKNLTMIDTIWSIVLPGAIIVWNLILMKTFFESIPDSLEESAKIDGYNDFQILWKIIIPVSVPIISAMVLFYAVGHWNNFFAPLIYLNTQSKYPLQIILRGIVISGEMNIANNLSTGGEVIMSQSIKFAVIIVSMVPMVVLYPFIQKYLIKGIMVGSIKG